MKGVFLFGWKGGVYLATVSAGLELMDRFTRPLNAVNTALQTTVRNSERLKSTLSQHMAINIDATNALRQVDQINSRVRRLGPGAAINIVINAADVENKIRAIQNRLRSTFTNAAVNITLNAGDIVGQARRIRQQIDSQLRNIRATINVEMPVQLTAMFGNLQMLVLRLIRVVRQLRTTSGENAGQLQSALQRIAALEAQILQLQGRVNNRIREGASASSGFLTNIQGIATTLLSIVGMQKLFSATIGGAMEQKKMEDMFIARTGDAEVGTAMFEKFKADALAAGQDVNKSLQSSLSFFSTTQNVDQLTQLNNLAQRLNAFDSAGNGIEGAAFALKEAMSGDIVSLAERFNMSKTDIRAFGVDEMGKAGDMEGFIKAFDLLLEKQKMGQAAFETMMASPAKQLEILGNNTKSMFADAGVAAMESLLPLITMLNTAFQAGTFDQFFSMLSSGLNWVVQNAMVLLGVITNVYNFFAENWGWIGPMIMSLGEAILMVWGAIKLVAIAQAVWNAVMAANPVVLFITVIVALIMWFYNLWRTNDAFAAGFMRTWNAVLNFFSKVPIFFARVGAGIANAFDSARATSLQILQDMANGAINIINSLIAKLNAIPGVSIDAVQQVTFAAGEAARAEANRQSREASIAGMEADASAKALEREQNVLDMLDNREAARQADAAKQAGSAAGAGKSYDFTEWNKAADAGRTPAPADDGKKKNIGKVDKVGKIEKEVDISSEDLKTMRELAEMKNIQNYVTLTPTIQVKTGDINNGMDIDTIVSRIEDVMTGEISTHASGVYGNGR
ncbi:hypothetical protein BK131_04605 [Paenibacillus amylolyticus]|uniref:Uncharacterized protein n=1 Tax=Paenibacillus amylolyticus TaxID=1451 RepID=A0A1R1C574_PAEAM|nr:hypothetical protein [Paenibacillus amylolyticus]OMF17250.1 hypothetical protein BK131_04605 [Paenibacillus amylolyticus]